MTYRRAGALGQTRVRLTRRRRRMLLALLAGADNMHAERLSAAAGVWSGTVYPFLEHLEKAGWVVRHRRRVYLRDVYCYDLTDEGRVHAAGALLLVFPGKSEARPGFAAPGRASTRSFRT